MGTCGGNPDTDDILREKHCKKHSDALTKYQSKRIIEQMDQSVCKMVDNHGTGFICMIPYPNDFNLLPVLIYSPTLSVYSLFLYILIYDFICSSVTSS